MVNIGIILAAGGLSSFDDRYPQLIKIAGKSVLEHTVDVFEKTPAIDEIAIVVNPNIKTTVEDFIVKNHWKKVKRLLLGGERRYKSAHIALTAYSSCPDETKILIHDALRPLVTPTIISDVLNKLDDYNAVSPVVSTADTVVNITKDDGIVTAIPRRSELFKEQTPQGFRLKTIYDAYELALKDTAFHATDDCGVVLQYLPNVPIGSVEGLQSNIKLTYPEDVYLLDKLFQIHAMNIHGEISGDKLKDKVIVVFGGNAGIGEAIINIANKHGAKCYSFSRSQNNCNIAIEEEVITSLANIHLKEGRIDYVINTAALLQKEPLMTMDKSKIRETLEVNYFGTVHVAMASYPYLKETKGKLLFFTSSSYTRGRSFYSLYSSTKAAVVNFMQAISEEWACDGIQVNCINPERTKTQMRVSNFGYEDEKTLLKAEEVAKVSLLTLTTDISGQVVDVKVRDFQ